VAVYNWERLPSVEVDLSSILKAGARFEVRNVQDDLHGKPAVAGVYEGKPVKVPTKRSAIAPDFEAYLVQPAMD
jgi:hypothetical protein